MTISYNGFSSCGQMECHAFASLYKYSLDESKILCTFSAFEKI